MFFTFWHHWLLNSSFGIDSTGHGLAFMVKKTKLLPQEVKHCLVKTIYQYQRGYSITSDAGRWKTLELPAVIIDGDNLPSPVAIGLTDLPNIGGRPVPPLAPPPVPAPLNWNWIGNRNRKLTSLFKTSNKSAFLQRGSFFLYSYFFFFLSQKKKCETEIFIRNIIFIILQLLCTHTVQFQSGQKKSYVEKR